MKKAVQVSEGAFFVPTYFETTIVQSFDAKTTVQISGTGIEEEQGQAEKVEQDPFRPVEVNK